MLKSLNTDTFQKTYYNTKFHSLTKYMGLFMRRMLTIIIYTTAVKEYTNVMVVMSVSILESNAKHINQHVGLLRNPKQV